MPSRIRLLATTVATGISLGGCAMIGGRSYPVADEATRVYEAVFASTWQGPAPVQVEDSTRAFVVPARMNHPLLQRQLAALPAGLAQRLAAISATRTSSSTLMLPAGTALLNSNESRRIQDQGYGGAVVLVVSPVAFSDDSTHALLYVEQHCGAVCGSGKAIWLARDSRGGWRVRGEVITAIQ